MNNTVQLFIDRHQKVLNNLLLETEIPAPRIREAIHYVLFPGGKRIRPLLVYLCGDLLNINLLSLDIIAASIELIHCYSLVHDDLPAMDNDNLRRGRPTCHRAFDEATAILVGDGMQALAVKILLQQLPKTISAPQVIQVVLELTKACGPDGMVSGQSLDLSELSNSKISETQLREIHFLKTGKLIEACINMVLAACTPRQIEKNALEQFAKLLGLVFQMQDDYLDRYGQISSLGKDRSSDAANHKITYASLYDKATLNQMIKNNFLAATQALEPFAGRADDLKYFVQYICQK